MGKTYATITEKHQDFIRQQKLFFVATATADSRLNLSPKGFDSLRILDSNRVAWLNLTGSGNETAAHLRQDSRMTLMFCAFEGRPLILRLYGQARAYHPRDGAFQLLAPLFPDLPGARQIIDMEIDLVQTSCGFGVPLSSYEGERQELIDWADRKGADGLQDYWQQKNATSLDGQDTGILGED